MDNDINSDERADLHLLYQMTVQDLAFFKAQQWSITNFTFLLYAAIVGLKQLLRASCFSSLLLGIIAVLVGTSSIYLLRRFEISIEGRRARLTFIRGKLSNVFNEAWGAMSKEEPTFLIPFRIMSAALGLGVVLTCWVIS